MAKRKGIKVTEAQLRKARGEPPPGRSRKATQADKDAKTEARAQAVDLLVEETSVDLRKLVELGGSANEVSAMLWQLINTVRGLDK